MDFPNKLPTFLDYFPVQSAPSFCGGRFEGKIMF